jgi:hypothetical protein
MRRFGIAGACLAVIAAFAVVSVASASAAEPALYECAKAPKVNKKYTGKYTDKKCSKEATKSEIEAGKTNKYELKEGIRKGKVFKGKGKGANLNVKGLGGIDCASSSNTGKFNSPTSAADVVATFKGCEFNGKKCESGTTAGEVITNPLKGGVGYLAGKGTKTPIVGADISAESGEVLATVHCGSLTIAVTGSVIGEVEPVNKFSKTATFIFKQSSKIGVQVWTHFEGGPEDTLLSHVCETEGCNPFKEGFTAESAEETTVTNKGEELMLKA